MQIHSTNVHGLGATQVVLSLIRAARKTIKDQPITGYFPDSSWLDKKELEGIDVKIYKRLLPNSISRVFELTFSRFFFPNKPTIVLGDIPLRGIRNQVVLVHQPNLIYPKYNMYSGKNLKFRINRLLFRLNNKYAKVIIVQTGAMASQLILSYPKIRNKVKVVPQPAPDWLSFEVRKKQRFQTEEITLFYPSAFYKHKMHYFLRNIDLYMKDNNINLPNFKIWLTLTPNEFSPYSDINFLENLGRLDSDQMNDCYRRCDAVLFLSSLESYGLPLIEALFLNLPVITVDFDYSRWIFENKAYYFKPYSVSSFLSSLNSLSEDLRDKKRLNYELLKNKFPQNWEKVFQVFAENIN